MRCEVCGCEHDGSYGSGRFCSPGCKQANNGSNKSKKWYESMRAAHHNMTRPGGWNCDFCGMNFRTEKELANHRRENHRVDGRKYACKYCGRVYLKAYQIAAHTARCKLSPNYEKNVEKTRQITLERFKGGLPEETKRKISDKLKKFYAEHPESASYKYNHYSKGSWAEDYFRDLFAKENVVGWESQYHVLRYRLDFAFIEEKIDFEVDGHQHKADARIVKHDIERTKNLKGIGWTVVRILWSDWNKMTKDEKRKWLAENLYCRLNQFRMACGRAGLCTGLQIGVTSQECGDENVANSTNSV